MIEGYAKPIIDALSERKPITRDQRQTLAAFVATLYLRTPGFRRTHDALHEAMMKHIMRFSFRNRDAAEAELGRMRAAGRDVGDITPEQAVEVGCGERYSIKFSQNEHQIDGASPADDRAIACRS
jgi:Protein of unknown function (DUF4238)